jgi:hypothetical protein
MPQEILEWDNAVADLFGSLKHEYVH